MTRYLLDTNIISDLFKNPGGDVDQTLRVLEQDGHEVGTSLVVIGEIKFGLLKNKNLRGLRHLELLLEGLVAWPLEAPIENAYADLRHRLHLAGKSVGPNDLWIACQAVLLEAVVVSDDKAFLNVPGLKVENWLRDQPAAT